jgi:hypothetical protein
MAAYREAFWVVAGTAAPVIGLAHVVAYGEIHKWLTAYREAERHVIWSVSPRPGSGLLTSVA